jgi:ABC-2 type transport system permease protein
VRRDLRVLLIGGLMSYRALFDWLGPWNLVPTLLVSPLCQILLFAYAGRSAGVGNDGFYVIGNSLNYASIPCLFAMAFTIQGEREGSTLGIVLTTPARRLPLFLGRALPVIVNGWGVAMFGVVVGSLLLGVHVPWSAWPAVALVVVVTSASCTGLGLMMGAISLRVRQAAVLGNVFFCVLLVFCGVNVAESDLPPWMAAVGSWLPLTHGIEAARELATGSSLGEVRGLVLTELGIAGIFTVIGLAMLRWLEWDSRRTASLERT